MSTDKDFEAAKKEYLEATIELERAMRNERTYAEIQPLLDAKTRAYARLQNLGDS